MANRAMQHVVLKCCIVIHFLPAASTVISFPSPGPATGIFMTVIRQVCTFTFLWHDNLVQILTQSQFFCDPCLLGVKNCAMPITKSSHYEESLF